MWVELRMHVKYNPRNCLDQLEGDFIYLIGHINGDGNVHITSTRTFDWVSMKCVLAGRSVVVLEGGITGIILRRAVVATAWLTE